MPNELRFADGEQGQSVDRATVRAVERAFNVLECFNVEQRTLSLTEAARGVGLPLSTVSRLLATLEAGDFVRRTTEGRYMPGGRLLRIGVMALHGIDLYDVAAPYLDQVASFTGETANLGVRVAGDKVLYIRQALSGHSIRHADWIGRTVPIEGTAIGAAISGKSGRDGVSLARVTLEPDVVALAAPLIGAEGDIVGAISVTGPSYRMTDASIESARVALLGAAKAISTSLGASSNARPGERGMPEIEVLK